MSSTSAPRIDSAAFVGRHAEAALLALTLDQSEAPGPSVLIVRGEPGIGKTRLLSEGVARAEAQGHRVLSIRANAFEARAPFGALSAALDRAAATDQAFSVASETMRAVIESPVGIESSSRLSFAQACSGFARTLRELAELSPTAVVVDDVHLLDQETLALLGVTLGRVAGAAVAFVCTTRLSTRDIGSHAAELLARLSEFEGAEDLTLGPLEEGDVASLLEGMFSIPVSPTVAETVTKRTGGNPLFVLEMAHSLSELDMLETGPAGITMPAAPAELHLTRHTAILRRLFPLSTECRRVAQIITILHQIRPEDLALVAELAHLDPASTAEAVDELERLSIVVRPFGHGWELFHPFAADALYDDIGPAERRRVHRAIADELQRQRTAGERVDPMRLAWHVAESADVGDLDAVATLTEVAELIKTTGPLSAATHCRRAIALLPPDASDQRGALESLRASCLIIAGRMGDAVDAGMNALAHLDAGDDRTRTATAVVGALFDVGREEEALALADAEFAAGTRSAFLNAQRALLNAALHRNSEARAAIADATAIPCRSPGEEVLVHSFLGSTMMALGPISAGMQHMDRLRELAATAGPNMSSYALARRCWMLVTASFLRAATAAADEADEALRDIGPGTYHVGVMASRVGIDWMRGEWHQALDRIVKTRHEPEVTGNAFIRRYLHAVELEIRTARGQLREALALANQPVAGRLPSLRAWSTAGVLLAMGDDDGARRTLRAALERQPDASLAPHLLTRLVELEVAAGDDVAASDALTRLRVCADPEEDPRPWVHAMLHRAVALVERDGDAARTSRDIADAEGLVFEAARARLVLGELDRDETDEVLAAHDALGTMGADLERRRAGAMLRERGAKVPRRRRRDPGLLSPAEAHIARLVQSGMRNREIARTTNYSERTVEVYLTRIYVKLGVSSRLQLARLVDERPDLLGEDLPVES